MSRASAERTLARRSAPRRRHRNPVAAMPADTLRDDSPGSYHLLWVTSALLVIAGMCMVLSVSVAEAVGGGDRYEYLRPQAIAAAAGLALLIVLSRIDYRRLREISVVFLAVSGVFLLLVHVPQLNTTGGGAASWFKLGPLTFQPSEFAKLALVLFGAHVLSSPRLRVSTFARYMWPFGAVGLGMCALVTLEGDLGTALIIAAVLMGMLWIAGFNGKQWALIAGTGTVLAVGLICSSEEKMARFFSFLNPSADPQGESYQLWQSLVALGRGGWLGMGPGQSVQKFEYLPKAHTDMIFSVLGEEFGLVGAMLVILLFAVFATACWKLARRCADPMGKYLLAGCGMLVTLQAIVNIGGVTGALPLTGVPLPFISYGRTSLVAMLMAVGLTLAVARQAPVLPGSSRSAARNSDNVTHIDSRRWDSGPRGARTGTR